MDSNHKNTGITSYTVCTNSNTNGQSVLLVDKNCKYIAKRMHRDARHDLTMPTPEMEIFLSLITSIYSV